MIDEKTLKCCMLLKDYFAGEYYTLANIEYPKVLKIGENDWLIYMFYSCLLNYGMRSKIYHQNLINTYLKYPHIFNPEYVLSLKENEEYLLNIIKNNIHPRYPNTALKKWLKLSENLVKYPNLLETIKRFKSFTDLNYFIKSLESYGQKTGGLLLRIIVDASICSNSNEIEFIPLDRHDIEISYLNGIINTKKLTESQIRDLSTKWIQNAKKINLSPSVIDKYLWEIGNQFCNSKKCLECPLHQTCQTKINKYLEESQ